MRCPECKTGEGAVLQTRQSKLGIRRRRRCITCRHRWSTVEVPAAVIERLSKLVHAAAALRSLFDKGPTRSDHGALQTASVLLREGGKEEWS